MRTDTSRTSSSRSFLQGGPYVRYILLKTDQEGICVLRTFNEPGRRLTNDPY